MRLPRPSLAVIMLVVVVIAVDLAAVRAVVLKHLAAPPAHGDATTFALLLLPMIDVLLVALYRLGRRARRTSGALSFFVAGTVATVGAFVASVAAPRTGTEVHRVVARAIFLTSDPYLVRLLGPAAFQDEAVYWTFLLVFVYFVPSLLFSLPPLIISWAACALARPTGRGPTSMPPLGPVAGT